MELHRLTRHCYYSDPIQEGDQPVMGLIAGACETLAVDTGNGPGRGLWLLQQAEKLGLPPVRWVVLTHWHWDHIMGGRAMQEAGVSLLCTQGTRRQLEVLSEYKWDNAYLAQRVAEGLEIPFCQEAIQVEYPNEPRSLDPPLPDIALEGPLSIDLEGVTVRLFPQPCDHSMDGLLVHCPEDKVVFLGDSLYLNMYQSPWHYTQEKLFPLLDTLEGLKADWYLPAHHDKPMTGEAFLEFSQEQRRYSQAAGRDVTMKAALERLREKLGREPGEEEQEGLRAFILGNIVKER